MLKQYRKQIDEIDSQLWQLLEQRFTISDAIGKYKKANKLDVLDNEREQQILKQIDDNAYNHSKQIQLAAKQIMAISKEQQSE